MKEKMLSIIDQMRVSIPEEIKKAQQMLTQKDRVLAQAQEEANPHASIGQGKKQINWWKKTR